MIKLNATRAVERCERLAVLGMPPPANRPRLLARWLKAYRSIMSEDRIDFEVVLPEDEGNFKIGMRIE